MLPGGMMRPRLLRLLLASVLFATLFGSAHADLRAAGTGGWERAPGTMTVLYADEQEVQTYVAPPAQATYLRAQAATITVDYEGFSPEARASFQYAVDIWQSL